MERTNMSWLKFKPEHVKNKPNNNSAYILFIFIVASATVAYYLLSKDDFTMKAKKVSKVSQDVSLEALPKWDLSILYKSLDDRIIEDDIKRILSEIDRFVHTYQHKDFKTMNAIELHNAIQWYEKISLSSYKLSLFASLLFTKDSKDVKVTQFYAKIHEVGSDWSSKMNFLKHKLFDIPDSRYALLYKDPQLASYKPFITDVVKYRSHKMLPEVERFNIETSPAASGAIVKFYDQTLSSISIKYKGETLNLSQALNKMQSKDKKERLEVAKLVNIELGKKENEFLFVLNSLLYGKQVRDKWMNYGSPVAAELMSNSIDEQTLNDMVNTVEAWYPKTAHKYYKLKAKILGMKKLNYSDRNAPMPFDYDSKFKWDEAKDLVINTYGNLSPEFGQKAKWFFNTNRVDAEILPYKRSGAFCTNIEPFVMLNYMGKLNDVTTLAHEIGHGIQMKLSVTKYGPLMSDAPLILAEVPSTFGESIVLKRLLNETKSKKDRLALMATRIESALNTITRQVAFHKFEEKTHALRKERELSADDVKKIWTEISKNQLGDSVIVDENFENYWSYISHFFHHPFYVHSYAVSDLITYSLLNLYEQNPAEFATKYTEFVTNSSIVPFKELLQSIGLTPDIAFWEAGMRNIANMIDEFESELKSL